MDLKKYKIKNEAYTGDGILYNSDFLNDLPVNDAIEKAIEVINKNIMFLIFILILFKMRRES